MQAIQGIIVTYFTPNPLITMSQSNSNLLAYLGLLLSDDAVLLNFVIDPITDSEKKYGLTKAERSVLRRTVANLSNKSVNGFTMARHLGSYRRSLRLLQNVLHNVGSKMVQDTMTAASKTNEQQYVVFPFSVICNYPTVNGPVDFTCETNATVDYSYGGPYANSTHPYTVFLPNPHPTIQEVMEAVNNVYTLPYTTVLITNPDGDAELYVKSFTLPNSSEITADLSNPCYELGKSIIPDFVFWFYSINGKAGVPKSTYGNIGVSFTQTTLNSGDTVYWQLIAPDAKYGFYPCKLTDGNAYAQSTSLSKAV